MKKLNSLLLVILFIATCNGFSQSRIVSNLSLTGPGSLQGEIFSALPGDTILINVAGDLVLNSPISISNISNITIIGPYPAYFNITGSGFSGELVQISSCSAISIQNVGFKGNGNTLRAVRSNSNFGFVKFERCLFENFTHNGDNGGAIFYDGDGSSPLSVNECSFINNKTDEYGGAIFVQQGLFHAVNCTFYLNATTGLSGSGGAIALLNNFDGSSITHCTFKDNDANVDGTCINAVNNAGIIYMWANAGAVNGSPGTLQFVGSTFQSDGGNIIAPNDGGFEIVPWSPGPNDLNDNTVVSALHTTIVEDGYGLKYYTIIDPTSSFCDVVPLSGTAGPPKDCRRAPRKLSANATFGTFDPSPIPDAGACEYTMLRVTSVSGNNGSQGNLPWAILQDFNAENYVEFDFVGDVDIEPDLAMIELNNPTYIDGYSQTGTKIPGPRGPGLPGVDGGNIDITISNASALSDGFYFTGTSSGSVVSGLRIVEFTQNGVFINASNVAVKGCQIGIDENQMGNGNFGSGVKVFDVPSCVIGGSQHWERNVITGNGLNIGIDSANVVLIGGGSHLIIGNIIGLDETGLLSVSSIGMGTGGIINNTNNTKIGAYRFLEGNTISGHPSFGILELNSSSSYIVHNKIGADYNGFAGIANNQGIRIEGTNTCTIGGNSGSKSRNIISNNIHSNIFIKDGDDHIILGNYIGIDSSGANSLVNPGAGILADGAGVTGIIIGDGSPLGRNIISGNVTGISIKETAGISYILDNYVGTNKNGNGSVANSTGVYIGPLAATCEIGQAGKGNLISGNVNSSAIGIHLDSTSNHSIVNNIIGLNAMGIGIIPNGTGISVDGGDSNTIGGDSTAQQGNLISGNNLNGILVHNNANETNIFGNWIGVTSLGNSGPGNGLNGIKIEGVTNTTVGALGTMANIISGHMNTGGTGVFCENSGLSTVLENNYIGTDVTGTLNIPNETGVRITDDHDVIFGTGSVGTENYVCASTQIGVHIFSPNVIMDGFSVGIGASNALINMGNTRGIVVEGPKATIGNSPFVMNIVSNNSVNGIELFGDGADSVKIAYCDIGLDQTGSGVAGNGNHGIFISDGDYNMIGSGGNNIMGNGAAGVLITGTAFDNQILNCNIGNVLGIAGSANNHGIEIIAGAKKNRIGGSILSEANIIGGNIQYGINTNADSNIVDGNYIGTDGAGALLPNDIGIAMGNCQGNVIGKDWIGIGLGNIISGNTNEGVAICCSSVGNIVSGNKIGINDGGNVATPNKIGVSLDFSSFNQVGGAKVLGLANIISSNINAGVKINNADSNYVEGNFIGMNGTNTSGIGGQNHGVVISGGSTGNEIGGERWLFGNHLAGNDSTGIKIDNSNGNLVLGNVVGAGPNNFQLYGILLDGAGTNNNTIGEAPKSIFGNIVYQNSNAGIRIQNASNNNTISSNIIGLDSVNTFSGNTQQPIGIEITPSAGYSPVGLSTSGAENVISANMIGILIDASSGQDIVNNFIGTDTTGLFPRGNTSAGIEISNGATNNIIGGVNPFHSNLISGNDYGVRIEDNLTDDNKLINNIIGLNVLQIDSIPNNYGVGINFGAQNNDVGGSALGEGNLISGNYFGVAIGAANNNFVIGNKIGAINSNVYGMILLGGSTGNVIGGSSFLERNIISNNDSIGIGFQNSPGNTVTGNFIGLNETGTTAEPNILGIYFDNSADNQIGGINVGEENIISGNSLAGVLLENNSNANIFENNFIGTDSTGNNSLGGFGNEVGMFIIDSDSNQVGGDWQANEGNVFAGNLIDGIYLSGAETNTIEGNNIGLSKNNNVYLPNGNDGIKVFDGSNGNFIGTPGTGYENIITASGNNGITVKFSSGNTIENNYIGNDELGGQGTVSNPGTNNQINGIKLDSGSVGNFIIGKNIICGNSQSQILLNGIGTNNNVIKANHIGVDYDGNVAYSSGLTGVYINNGASNNVIGGASTLDKNIIGGDLQDYIRFMGPNTDSNQVAGNNIGLGLDDLTMYSTANNGVAIFGNCQYNVIGGGLPNEGNTIVGINGYGILIQNATNNRVFGNEIGIKPDGSIGTIDSVGVRLENANSSYVGGLLVGSDSANVITNCDGGVDVTDWIGIGSSYGCPIIGNSIYNNTHQGIDIHGDNMILPNDTNNFNFDNNGLIDAPEIFEAWNCGGSGNTHIAFKYFSSNALGTYRIEVYENTTPDASGYGEGEIFIGSFPFNPSNPYDTIDLDLGMVLPVGTIIAATMTGTALNTSEFSLNDTVTAAPTFNVASVVDETCLNANNGYFLVTDPAPLQYSIDGGTTIIPNTDTIFASTGTYTIEALYVNGCILSDIQTLSPGNPLPFDFTVIEDTCGLGVGSITIDTVSTNAAGGSNNYSYTFNNGSAFETPIDTLNITAGTYNIGLVDNTLGCSSVIQSISVTEIIDVADESFTFADFCPDDTPLPVITGDTGGTWTCSNGSIDSSTGEILSPTPGNTYTVTYTVGVCNEFSTVDVTAADFDDSTFTYDDFCEGIVPNSPVATTPGGTWSLVSGTGTIDSNTGILTAAQGNYNVQYTTNGTCPTSMIQLVTVFDQPAAPQIITADSIYCPNEIYAEMSSSLTGDSYSWYNNPDHSNVLANTATYTPVSLAVGNNYYYLTITNAAGCESKHDSINYISADLSAMQADPDIVTCLSSTVTLGASGGIEYLWNSDVQIISDLEVSSPSATIGFDTEFVVRITDVFNCSVMDTLTVTLLPSDSCFVEVYNAFSPNNDGTNDIWIIDGIEGFEENHVYVYNRWGDVIMDFVNYDNSSVVWNGDNRLNKPLPAGTYFYVVEVGGTQNSAGWVQLVK